MGTCDVIPWVSGWTIAFITWIYDRLIDAIASFKPELFKLFWQKQIKKIRNHIDWAFLLALFSGIAIAIFSLARVVKKWLKYYPSQIWSFFIWLLIASIIILFKNISLTKKNIWQILCFILAWAVLWFLGTNFPLMQTEPTLLTTFFAGAIAIIAMILPWISGSYLLLMLNHYYHLLDIVSNIGNLENIIFLGVFLLWTLVWILSFAKLLSFIKKKYSNQLYAILTGIIIGSLQMLRPWKKAIEYYQNSKWESIPLIWEKIIPTDIKEILLAIGLMILWFMIVIWIDKLSKKIKTTN